MQTAAGRTGTDSLLFGAALVFSPHQDDETIGCGLLMAEKRIRGIPVVVAVATDGRGGWYSPTERPAPDDIVEIRHREWHEALDALAIPRANRFEFGFPDGGLHDHEAELADRIGDLLRTVRPAQVFVTQPGDPHPDHSTLARAVRQAVSRIYDFGPGLSHAGVANGSPVGPRPQVFTYRVYPGEGLWRHGRPSGARAAVAQGGRALLGLPNRRPMLFRGPGSRPTKITAIDAYDSQRRLLGGELRYVWGARVELYWPMEGLG